MIKILIFLKLISQISSNLTSCSVQSCNSLDCCLVIDFKQFDELKFSCNQRYKFINQILIKPKNELIINSDLEFTGLRLRLNEYRFAKIIFINIKGFELNSNPFETSNSLNVQNIIL